MKKITRIGIGGPVGSGKTALVESIAPVLIGMGVKVLVITNDVVTTEDAKHVQRTLKGILLEEKILGVETGACPHTAVREDPSMIRARKAGRKLGRPEGSVSVILKLSDIQRLQKEGLGLRAIARRLGCSVNTVQRVRHRDGK